MKVNNPQYLLKPFSIITALGIVWGVVRYLPNIQITVNVQVESRQTNPECKLFCRSY